MLLNISFEELRDFFTIILWITIPAILIASGVAIYLHYRKKRSTQFFSLAYAGSEGNGQANAKPPEGTGWENHYDKSELMLLLKKYEQDIELHMDTHERLKVEFNELEEKYMNLETKLVNQPSSSNGVDNESVVRLQEKLKEYESSIDYLENALQDLQSKSNNSNSNNSDSEEAAEWKLLLEEQELLMAQQQTAFDKKDEELKQNISQVKQLKEKITQLEKNNAQLGTQVSQSSSQVSTQIAQKEKKWQEEKEDLNKKINMVNSKLETVKKENEWLKEQASKLAAATPVDNSQEYRLKLEEIQLHYKQLEQENEAIKSKITNQEFAEDLVTEKKLQIEFLQNQLEQRIKSFREMETQFNSNKLSIQMLEESSRKYEEELVSIRLVLQTREKEFSQLKDTSEKTIGSKVTHIELLEREMSNLQRQSNSLQLSLDERSKANAVLNKDVESQATLVQELEGKLDSLNNEFKSQTTLVQELEGKLGSLNSDFKSKVAQVQDLESKLGTLNKDFKSQASYVQDLENKLTTSNKELQVQTSHARELESKLQVNNQLFSKIYGELSKTMDEPATGTNGQPALNGSSK